jgi:hypothetical protein
MKQPGWSRTTQEGVRLAPQVRGVMVVVVGYVCGVCLVRLSKLAVLGRPTGFHLPLTRGMYDTWISGSDVNPFCCYGLVYLLDSW